MIWVTTPELWRAAGGWVCVEAPLSDDFVLKECSDGSTQEPVLFACNDSETFAVSTHKTAGPLIFGAAEQENAVAVGHVTSYLSLKRVRPHFGGLWGLLRGGAMRLEDILSTTACSRQELLQRLFQQQEFIIDVVPQPVVFPLPNNDAFVSSLMRSLRQSDLDLDNVPFAWFVEQMRLLRSGVPRCY